MNVAYRWFLGLKLTDPVPHSSTISQNRRRRFLQAHVEFELFVSVVKQAAEAGFIDGSTLFTDSIHIKANASKHSIVSKRAQDVPKEVVERSVQRHLTAMEEERGLLDDDTEGDLAAAIQADRELAGKKTLDLASGESAEPKPEAETVDVTKAPVSLTDPEAGYMVREGKPKGVHYFEHRTVEGRYGFIVDLMVTSARLADPVVYLTCLKATQLLHDFKVKAVGLDAGYYTNTICHALAERGVFAAIAPRRTKPAKRMLSKWRYHVWNLDAYLCPGDHLLLYTTTNREGYR